MEVATRHRRVRRPLIEDPIAPGVPFSKPLSGLPRGEVVAGNPARARVLRMNQGTPAKD